MAIELLSAREVATKTKPGIYGDGGGLYLKVTPSGTKSWVYRYWSGGHRRALGLGPFHTVTLAEARDKAREQRRLRLSGLDPATVKRAKAAERRAGTAKAMTFEQCAKAYIKAHEAGWRSAKHAAQWSATLETYVYPVFGGLPVEAVDVEMVMKAVEPIWAAKPETASRVRGRIESILDWATVHQYRKGENPARWRGHLENLLPKKTKVRAVAHHAALPYAKMAVFMVALRKLGGIAARALEFAILTTARTGEVIGARWDEIDLDNRLWTIPAERMKAGKEHRVPLSDDALAILEAMKNQRTDDHVFPGGVAGRPLSNMALLMTLRRMKRDDLTAHGFRSTFSDWCAERTTYPAEVREMALAHVVGDKVEAAYRRGDLFDKRRKVMDDWATFCAQPAAGANNVRLIRATS